jgi:hypothetical protein
VVRSSGSLKYVAINGGGVRLATKTEEGSAQRSPGTDKKLRMVMPGIVGACGVDSFGQLGSGSSRCPAHGGDGDSFGEWRAWLGRPTAGIEEVSVVATARHSGASQRALTRGDGGIGLEEAPLPEEATADRQF